MPPSAKQIRTLLTESYLADPLIEWLFAGVDEAQHAVSAWLNVFVERYLESGRTEVTTREGHLTGVAMWRAPEGLLPGTIGLPSSGGLFASLVGAARADELGRALHKIADVLPAERHIYLHFFAIATDTRRTGAGTQLLRHVLKDAEDQLAPIHLETTNPDAVPFYEANGFHVSHELNLETGGPHLWAMLRK